VRNKLFHIFISISSLLQAQRGLFINGIDASLRVDSTCFISVDGDFQNLKCDPVRQVRFNGPLYLSGNLINNDILKFTATTGAGNSKKARIIFLNSLTNPSASLAVIGGSVIPKFWEVEVDKGLGALTLNTDINCQDTLNFKTGLVYMNGRKWNMVDPIGAPSVINHPYLNNERNGCQFMATTISDTGLVIYKTIYNYSINIDPGNIGIKINGLLNIGSPFDVYRGFVPQVNAGKSSVQTYFDVYSPGHSLANNTVTVKYTNNNMAYFMPGYFNLPALKLFVSGNEDMNWSPMFSTIQNTLVSLSGPVNNGVLTANVSDLVAPNINILPKSFRITVADPSCPNPPISGLLLDTLHICIGNSTLLDAGNNSSVPNSSLRWEWDTNPIAYTQTYSVIPNTTYQKYVVKLMDARGCVTKDSVIIAPQAPFPQITYFNHLNSCLGDSVIIKDTVKLSSGTYSNSWLFSDGSTSSTSQKLFKKKFATIGDYSMQLTTTSNYGCSVTATSTNIVVYPLPTASFTNSINCLNGLMSFTSTSVSNHTALVISSSLWNLGQGATNTSTLLTPSQTYSSSGTFSVKLVSTSSFGCKDSVLNSVIIYPSNNSAFTKNNSCFNDTVFLNNTSACNTGSCTYHWSFGDATQSGSFSPKKIYAATGLFVVKLKITNPLGCPDSVSTSVFINPKPLTQFVATNTTACINDFIYFTNTSSINSGSISSYLWNYANTNTSATTNGVATYSIAGIYNVSLIAASDSGCVTNFILPVTAQPQPTAQYAVSSVCYGSASQFVSSSIGPGLNYIWNYGNSVITNTTNNNTQNYIYSSTGTYTTELIAINSWGCSDTTSVTTIVFASPVAALGGSVSTCATTYTLNAGNNGSTYLWQPGNQTTQTLQVTSSGIYQSHITNTNNCSGTETVMVALNAIVKPHLGNDTTVCGPFNLNAGYPGSNYLWSTTDVSQSITATSTNPYVVQVTDQNGCIGSDTINLIINNPAIANLGNDLSICKPKYSFVLTPTTNATSFIWNNGITSPTLNISTNGSYWLEATSVNGCKKRDTIIINFLNTPQINLGPDKSVCGTTLLDAQNSGCTYLWNTGSTYQTLNATLTDNYWITVTNTLTACYQQDSVNITVNPLITVFLGNDTTLCNNTNFQLNANNPGAIYNWTNGQNSQNIPVSSSGIYGVTVTNTGGCFSSDYITITLIGAPIVDLGNSIRYLCGNNSVELEVTTTAQVNWGSSTGQSSTTKYFNIYQPGKYWAEVNDYGCSASDSVLVVATNNTIQALFLASTQDTVNTPVKFVCLSDPEPVSQVWSFGDGLTSNELNPVHTFILPHDFSVTLEVSNGFCTDKITKQLSVLFRQSSHAVYQPKSKLALLGFNVYPNPAESYLQIDFELNDFAPIELRIFDISGRLLLEESSGIRIQLSTILNTSEFKSGLYILNLSAHSAKGEISKTTKFIKTN